MGQHSQIKMVGVHQSGNRGQFKRVSSARKLTFYDTKKEPVGSFSHHVTPNQPTNWAVSMITRLRCILSSLSNSR